MAAKSKRPSRDDGNPEIIPWLRPSAFPRLAICPASGVTSEGQANSSGQAAARGKAFHAAIANRLKNGKVRDLSAICLENGVTDQEGANVVGDWLEAFSWTPPEGATLFVEESIPGPISGMPPCRPDLVFKPEDGPLTVIDFKTGNPDFHDASQWQQLACYAVAAGNHYGSSVVRVELCYVQLGSEGWLPPMMVDVAATIVDIARIAGRAMAQGGLPIERREFNVGPACTFCPGRGVCPARSAELTMFAKIAERDMDSIPVTTDNIFEIREKRLMIEKVLDAVKEAERLLVNQVGQILSPDGSKVMKIVTSFRTATMPDPSKPKIKTSSVKVVNAK